MFSADGGHLDTAPHAFRATSVSKACQEAATYLCECIVAFEKQRQETAPHEEEGNSASKVVEQTEYYMAIHRYLAAFLAVGGAKITDAKLLGEALPILQRICGKGEAVGLTVRRRK